MTALLVTIINVTEKYQGKKAIKLQSQLRQHQLIECPLQNYKKYKTYQHQSLVPG
jgi:hypothetical protein